MLEAIARELGQAGFVAQVAGNAVKVTLKSRRVYAMEVWFELREQLEGITFTVKGVPDGVLVRIGER